MPHYAVRKGKIPGIYETWAEAKEQISGFKGAVYKKFTQYEDALKYYNDCQDLKTSEGRFQIYTDGSYKKKRAGWGVVMVSEDGLNYSTYGGPVPLEKHTNNTGELFAILQAVIQFILSNKESVEIISDSQYSIRSVTEWIHGWKMNGWKNSKGKDVKNQDLIKAIDKVIVGRDIKFTHVKAHNGDVYNEIADGVANRGADAAIGDIPKSNDAGVVSTTVEINGTAMGASFDINHMDPKSPSLPGYSEFVPLDHN